MESVVEEVYLDSDCFHLQFISDLHLESRTDPLPIIDIIAPMLAICGDLGKPKHPSYNAFLLWASTHYQWVWLIAGNHEYYHSGMDHLEIDSLIHQLISQYHNARFLMNDTIIVKYHGGQKSIQIFGGTLWSNDCGYDLKDLMNDYQCIKKKVHQRDGSYQRRTITTHDTTEWHHVALKSLQHSIQLALSSHRQMVVLTHHLPSFRSLSVNEGDSVVNMGYASELDDLLKYPIVLWIHGHSHHSVDWWNNQTHIISNPMGYQSESMTGVTKSSLPHTYPSKNVILSSH